MRVLVAIPHYANPNSGHEPAGQVHGSLSVDPTPRIEALTECISSLHELFNPARCLINHGRKRAEWIEQTNTCKIEIVVCTTHGLHLLGRLPVEPRYYRHHETNAEPLFLGFECHKVLRDALGGFDYYCYLEDDLILHDPWLFIKLRWFNAYVGDDKLLQPNRFEAGLNAPAAKTYVDGDLPDSETSSFQDVTDTPPLTAEVMGTRVLFQRTKNPHAGCFFLNERQMRHWTAQPWFLDRDVRFVGPLESAATLGIMRTFRVYRSAPANADFLEVQHFGTNYLNQICPPKAD